MRRKVLLPLIACVFAACRGGAPRALTAADREVKSVEVSRGRESFVLTQTAPGVWRVAPPDDEADAADAAALLAGLRALTPRTRLAKGAETAYVLSDKDATVVRVRAGDARDTVFEARFGRRGLGDAVHMAAGRDGAAFLGEGPSPDLLARGAQDWRERRLMGESCTDVAIDAGRGWRAASSATAAALCRLRASTLLPALPEFLAGLDRPILRVRSGAGAFQVGARMGGERWVRVDGRPALFRAPAAPLAAAVIEASR
jgi:hypothetical protein